MTETLRVAIIMAGGSGERFWPVSRSNLPKQLLSLTPGGGTMLENTVRLVEPLIPAQHIFVITSKNLLDTTRAGRGSVPEANIIAEPERRNTCGCLAYAAAWLLARFDMPPEKITMAVVTADHEIGDAGQYRATLQAAIEAAEHGETLGVIGIQPARPETGYGYIELPPSAKPVRKSSQGIKTWPVARFREKPNRQMAAELIETGRCYWNSGMFFWRLSTFLAEMERVNPDLQHGIVAMAAALRAGEPERVESIFQTIRSLPIDIALLERSQNVAMTEGGFCWEDVGAWDAVARLHEADAAGNVAIGAPVIIDSKDCVVYNAAQSGAMDVVVVGVEGLAVVATEDGVLVVAKDRAQDVKRAVAELKKRGAKSL